MLYPAELWAPLGEINPRVGIVEIADFIRPARREESEIRWSAKRQWATQPVSGWGRLGPQSEC
jgi:hypothetical protein